MAHLTTLALAAFGTGLLLGLLQRSTPDPEPAPAEPEPERSPDWCITHGELEPESER